jgi:hypothetical protein
LGRLLIFGREMLEIELRSAIKPKMRLRLTGAEVLGFLVYLPGERCARALRVHFFAMQGKSIARLDVCRVASQGVNPFVFFVRHAHPVRSRGDASRNRSLFPRFVNDYHCYYDQGDRHGHDSDDGTTYLISEWIIRCPSGDGKGHTECHNQGSTPEEFLRHIVLLMPNGIRACEGPAAHSPPKLKLCQSPKVNSGGGSFIA